MLEIEIDQTGIGLGAAVALEQQHRGFDRERGQPDAAGGREKSINLCVGGAARLCGLRGARAGAHEVERGDRLHDEVSDPHLQQLPRDMAADEPGGSGDQILHATAF